MNEGLISRRYAKAMYDWAAENGTEDELYASFDRLLAVLSDMPSLSAALRDKMVDKSQENILLDEVFEGPAPEVYRQAVGMVVANGRSVCLQNIALCYQRLYRSVHNISVVKISSVVELEPLLTERLAAIIESKTHGKVEFDTLIDPQLEGGMIIQIDDMRLDGSVRGQMESIRRQFIQKNRVIV